MIDLCILIHTNQHQATQNEIFSNRNTKFEVQIKFKCRKIGEKYQFNFDFSH